MANTTIQLKSSGTTANIPALENLANGEIALNYADGILYYRTSAGSVESIRGEPTGLAGEIQFNAGGNFGSSANLAFNSTTKVLTVDHATIASLNIAPYAIAAFDAANTKFASTGGTVTGNMTVTGNILMSGTGYLDVPSGTTAQRPAVPNTGMFRYNSTTGAFEVYTSDWTAIGGSSSSITTNGLFENANTITAAYTISVGNNGLSSGPITMTSNGSVTVPTGSTWTIV